jgi:hypothetical protein
LTIGMKINGGEMIVSAKMTTMTSPYIFLVISLSEHFLQTKLVEIVN